MLDLIAIAALDVVMFAGVPVLVMWIVGRFLGRRTAMAIGFLAIAFDVYLIVDAHRVCSAEPVIRPGRTPESLGVIYSQCDSLAGAALHILIWYGGPISVALLIVATVFQYREFRRKRYL